MKVFVACFVCLLLGISAGGYFGFIWGASLGEEAIITSIHEKEKEAFECGVSGDISCFKDAYKSIAIFYWTTATLLIEGNTPSLQTEKLTEVKNWNNAVQMELLYSQDEELKK